MGSDRPAIELPHAERAEVLRQPSASRWQYLWAQGAAIVGLGVLAIAWPAFAAVDPDVFAGWLFIASGVTGLAALVAAEDVPGFLWTMLTAALSLLTGILLIWNPAGVRMALTLMLTALFVAEGAFQAAIAFSCRHVFRDAWGWMLLSGVADLVLAALIMVGWPNAAGRTLELFVGINLISSGWAATRLALTR